MQWIPRGTLAALCGFALCMPVASATTWVVFEKYERLPSTTAVYEWDTESLSLVTDPSAPNAQPILSVTWRDYSTSNSLQDPGSVWINKSRVFCGELGLDTYYREWIALLKDGRPGWRMGGPLETPPSDRPTSWATWNSADGKLARAVCQAAFPDQTPAFLSAHEQVCSGKTSGMCSPENSDLASSISLLMYRQQQAGRACTTQLDLPGKATYTVLSEEATKDVLSEVAKCEDMRCKMNAVYGMVSSLNADLEKASKGQPCHAVQRRIAKIDRDKQIEKGKEGMRAYLACAASKAPVLDDGISAAESVAVALHSACQETFNAAATLLLQDQANRNHLASQFQPKLIEMVFQHRAALRAKKQPSRQNSSKRIQS